MPHIVKFTVERLRRMPRPQGYLDECRECAIDDDGATMTFDATLPCYRAMVEKYRGKHYVQKVLPSILQRSGGGCGRCGGGATPRPEPAPSPPLPSSGTAPAAG